MEILELIEQLEQLATSSKKVPLTGKRMVQADRLLGLVDKMRQAIPNDVLQAQELAEKREEIITQALTNANRVKAAAEQESRLRVSEGELVKIAKHQSEEIITAAEERARTLMQRVQVELESRRTGADQYANEVLSSLEQDLSTVLESVRRGLSILNPTPVVQSPAPKAEEAATAPAS